MAIAIQDAAALIEALGSTQVGPALDVLTRRFVGFEMSCIFAFHSQFPPALVYDGYSTTVPRQTLSAYLSGGYLLDPYYVASIDATSAGLWRMEQLAPDNFFGSEFAGSASVHPCVSTEQGVLVEELGYVVPLSGGWAATYSLMRTRGSRRFADSEFRSLEDLIPIVTASLRHHWAISMDSKTTNAGDVDTALETAFGSALTPAQFRVVTMVLRGHSSVSIARILGVSQGTVKVHRHNAYKRLDVTSQVDLFALFIAALEAGSDRN